MKLTKTFTISFLIFGLFASVALSGSFVYIMDNLLMEQAHGFLRDIAQSRANHIEMFLHEQKEKVKIFSNNDFIEESLATDSTKDLNEELEEVLQADDHFLEVFILDNKGIIIASTNGEFIGDDKSKDSYFVNAKEQVYVKDFYYSETRKDNLMTVSVPIIKDGTKEFLGVVVTRIETEELEEITTDRTGLGRTGEIYIINKEGYLITSSRFLGDKNKGILIQVVDTENSRSCLGSIMIYGSDSEMLKKHSREGAVSFSFLDYRGEVVLGAHAHIAEVDWCVLAEIDKAEDVDIPRNKFIMVSVFVSLFLIVVFGFVGYFVSKVFENKFSRGRAR